MLRSTLTSTLRSVQPARLFTNTAIPKMPYTQSAKLPESHSKFANDGEPKLHLLTKGTPNGLKVHALLEELREAYPQNAKLAYDFVDIQFDKKEQKSPEFLEVNPNGRIPALVDDNVKDPATGKGHNVFESASILIWLVENYDTENKFWFKDPILRSKAISWIFFGHGGVGPMQGQANHFFRYAPEKIPYGIKRYQEETRRLFDVVEDGLKAGKGEYLVGDKYSIVDISIFSWIRSHSWAGIPDVNEKSLPLLTAWLDRIEKRPGTDRALGVPERMKKNLTPEEQEEKAKEAAKWIMNEKN